MAESKEGNIVGSGFGRGLGKLLGSHREQGWLRLAPRKVIRPRTKVMVDPILVVGNRVNEWSGSTLQSCLATRLLVRTCHPKGVGMSHSSGCNIAATRGYL